MYRIHIFLDEAGCILNEKMMPDITIMVPQLEIDKTLIENKYFKGQMWCNKKTSGSCTHKPSNSLFVSKKLSGASPYVELS
jgi:hypothetical protein